MSYRRFRDYLGPPVVPFCPFSFWAPLLKPNSRKKGTLIFKGLLGNLVTFILGCELLFLCSDLGYCLTSSCRFAQKCMI